MKLILAEVFLGFGLGVLAGKHIGGELLYVVPIAIGWAFLIWDWKKSK